ncbi:MAG: nucleotidyltransferase domain-containing protein, partial [Candidatus Heimdallarchaeota archaeon]|nr:nucleotidyltransferase domain-containing protein [Candidatus Heimdallarchaeota archaeon]MCK4291483.1 nucleotidyltransferase domain-containing protein [Candidatus Heimdallarchaeota archaeon]
TKLVETVPDIDLVLLYGSFARGLGHELSDYDIIIICDTKKVVWEFILKERVVKAWSMTWEHAEKVVTGKTNVWITAAAALTHGIVLWEKSKEHHKKLEKVIEKVSEGSVTSVEKVLYWYESYYGKLWMINNSIKTGKTENVRFFIQEVANGICYALSGINNQYYLNNWGKQLPEIEEFSIKPENFTERYTEMVTAQPVRALEIAEDLLDETHKLLIGWLEKNKPHSSETYKGIVTEWPSVIEALNAIKSSAKKSNIAGIVFAVFDFTEMIFWAYMILQNKIWNRTIFYPMDEYLRKLPKVIRKDAEVLLYSNQMDELVFAAENITKDLKQRLIAKGAKLPIAKSLEDGAQFIQQWDL